MIDLTSQICYNFATIFAFFKDLQQPEEFLFPEKLPILDFKQCILKERHVQHVLQVACSYKDNWFKFAISRCTPSLEKSHFSFLGLSK